MSLIRLIQLFGSDKNKYANVLEANTARTPGTIVVATQQVDSTGKVPPSGDVVGNAPFVKLTNGANTAAIDVANTARTTGTIVQAVQVVDASGKVPPAGDAYNNAPFANSRFVDENGVAYGVKHISNKPRVSSMPYLYDIAEGNVTGHTPFAKLGLNLDVGATEEDIITQGGTYYWIPTATALEVVSSNANDTLAGTGVQKVRISYLDADYSEASEIISLNGVTPVSLTDTTILRVNSIRATQVGSGGVAAGNITCRTVAGANVVRQIATGYTRGRGLTYTVPLGKTLYITSISVSSGYTTSGKVVRWTGRAQVDDSAPTVKLSFFQPFFEIMTQDSSFHRCFEIPIVIPATADLKMSAISDGAGSFCNCALRGWLEV